jgi:hypothetical protein
LHCKAMNGEVVLYPLIFIYNVYMFVCGLEIRF